jgi:hypothetical protein
MSKTRLLRWLLPTGFLAFYLFGGVADRPGGVAAGGNAGPAFAGAAEAAPNAASDEPDRYFSSEGAYAFRFPGQPKIAEQKHRVSNILVDIHLASYVSPGGTAYIVAYFDVPQAAVDKASADLLLESAVHGAVTMGGWRVTSKKDLKLGEYPGRDVTGEVTARGAPELGYGRMRLYLVENRLYQIVLLGSQSKVSPDDFEKCLESFEILPGALALALAQAKASQPAAGVPGSPRTRRWREQLARRTPGLDNPPTTSPVQRDASPVQAATDQTPGPDPSKPAQVAIGVNLASASLIELPRRPEGWPVRGEKFRETSPNGGLLVGLRVGYTNTRAGLKLSSIQPIYQAGSSYIEGMRQGIAVPTETTVVAKPGYAVGGVNVRSGLLVDAVQLVFMKYENGQLDPAESYVSAWLGDSRGGFSRSVSGQGKIVAGIHGTTKEHKVNELGLVVAE